MKIGVIGAGFVGLAAAYTLAKAGYDVTVIEKDEHPGGLALGFKEKTWDWTLEHHYHHWFTNDKAVLALAKELEYPILIERPKTSVFVANNIYQLDSPKHVLSFPQLPIVDKVRMAAIIGMLRYDPFWKPLEKIKAHTFLAKTMGEKAYTMLWKPQLQNKFGQTMYDVSLAWFWARIVKRTPSLAYPQGGFLSFAKSLVSAIEHYGGTVHFATDVRSLNDDEVPTVTYLQQGKELQETFDNVIVTVPSPIFIKITPQLPTDYKEKLQKLKGLAAMNLVLRLKKAFFTDNTYWLSVCDPQAPVMAVVEHTNFMDKNHYANEHIIYVGKYLPIDDPLFTMDKQAVLQTYDAFLTKLNPNYKDSIIAYEVFKAPFAQPIIPTNYSKMIPPFETPLPHVYLANIQQVYPWDRGTNYAVELGQKIAQKIANET